MKKPAKVRVDQLVVSLGLAPTRARAQAMIMAGEVVVDDRRVDKAGALVREDANVRLKGEPLRYVSRGGIKLEGALDDFALSPDGMRCLDIGASTGGFTDCLLQRGARDVVAVDVGYGQLADRLRKDARVTVMERTNARDLEPQAIGGTFDLVVCDASFIGLGKLAEAMCRCTSPGGLIVALVKPQFEIGPEEAARTKGVVRDPELRRQAIEQATRDLEDHGLAIERVVDCKLPGPKGNVEAFVLARRPTSTTG